MRKASVAGVIVGQEQHTPQPQRLQPPRRLWLRSSRFATRRPLRDGAAEDVFQVGDEVRGAERPALRLGGPDRGLQRIEPYIEGASSFRFSRRVWLVGLLSRRSRSI
jgi:hypothetical protein